MAKITEALLRDILQAVGGAQNIAACGHCMTRLRLTLNHPEQVDLARLKSLPGVLGVIDSEAQLQIVLGPGKAQTAAEVMQSLLTQDETALAPQNETPELSQLAAQQKQQLKAKQTSGVHQFLSRFATIFTPLIPGFIARDCCWDLPR